MSKSIETPSRKPLEIPKEGEIDRVIRAFNQYEVDNFTTCLDAKGLHWWCVVRYSVVHALCLERGLYGNQRPVNSYAAKARSFLRQSAKLVKDVVVVTLMPSRQVDTIYVSRRHIGVLAEDIRNNTNPCLVVGGPAIDHGHHTTIAKQSIDFFVRLAWRRMRLPNSVAREAERIDTELRSIFGSTLDIRQIIITKYRQHRAANIAWSFILSRLKGTQRIVFANDDTLKTLVHIARGRDIATREVQHAYMGRSHEGFSYPPLSAPLSTLPDEVVLIRDTGDIVYPVPKVTLGTQDAAKRIETVPRDIDVLLGSSPRQVSETNAIVIALADMGLRIAVKLHPAQNEDSLDINLQSTPEQIEIHSGQTDFQALARRSHIYVPVSANSTTGFEAAESGAKVITINYNGRKLIEMLDGIISESVDSINELPDAIHAQLAQTPRTLRKRYPDHTSA